ncbi:hypothetical protein ABW20_dc0100577 [Dactylellina cionopaga]|nr:hypothetical protein ABW20_dc0100577 [Dactylellina cionopaga]
MAMPIQIGDVIALANMCYGIAQAFGSGRKAAPVEFREVQNELYGLGQMLELLQSSVDTGAITSKSRYGPSSAHQASQSIARMITNCQNTVDHLKEFARKYAPLAGVQIIEDRSGITVKKLASNSRQKIKVNWKRIMWVTEASNIQGIRDQISIHVQSITAVVSLVNTYAEGHRLDLHGARTEIHGARTEIHGVHLGVSAANANIQHVSSGLHMVRQDVHALDQTVRQDIQSLNHKLETIMAWQQRDMPEQALQQQLSHLLVKIEQLERMPPAAQPCPPSVSGPSGSLPYPLDDSHIPMPYPYDQASSYSASAGFYHSTNSSMPNFSNHQSTSNYNAPPARSVTQYAAASITIAELPTRTPTRKGRTTSFSSETILENSRRITPINSEPVEIAQFIAEEDLPPRGSRATATDM